MQTSRLLTIARRAAALTVRRTGPRINATQPGIRPHQRALCGPAQTPKHPQPQTPPSATAAATAAEPAVKPTGGVSKGESAAPQAATGSATTPAPAAAPATAGATAETAGATGGAAKGPDIPSMSLGLLEEEHAKDPNKWKKFAWKYAGAVLLFFVSYKSLHWYVARVEAEGKRKRAQLDEDRKLAAELRANSPGTAKPADDAESQPQPQPQFGAPQFSTAANASAAAVPPVAGGPDTLPQPEQSSQEPFEFLEQIAAQVPKGSSELDELYAFRKELQGQLDGLRKRGGAADASEVTDVEAELAAVVEDIAQLEKKQGKSQ